MSDGFKDMLRFAAGIQMLLCVAAIIWCVGKLYFS
jgi:hypothetical protein